MGQLFAPRAFGSKKCVVLTFVVRPTIHSRFEFTSAEASGSLNSRPLKPQDHSRFEFTSAEASGNLGFPIQSYQVSDGTAFRATGVRLKKMRSSDFRCETDHSFTF